MTSERSDIAFGTGDGLVLRGWLYRPEGSAGARLPAISMAHGFGAVKEHGLDRFARAFAEAGFIVLVHDHRNCGASDGLPRHDLDPWQQMADWRRAISFLEGLDGVDPARIGIWGTSYAGGHALMLGATDRRIRCVVAQVPTVSGFEQGRRRVAPVATIALEQRFAKDERAVFGGEEPARTAIVSADAAVAAAFRDPEAIAFYTQPAARESWINEVTLRSTRMARSYEPGVWAARISPTPLLLVVAMEDMITMTDLALDAYERALQPKRLGMIPGGHFAPYDARFGEASSAAVDWFGTHLQPG